MANELWEEEQQNSIGSMAVGDGPISSWMTYASEISGNK